jgi:mannose-6-phosphate isomerase
MRNLGGNEVEAVLFDQERPFVFSTEPYYYALHQVKPGAALHIPPLEAATVYAYEIPEGAVVEEGAANTILSRGDAVQIQKSSVQIRVLSGGAASFLVSGVPSSREKSGIRVFSASQIKKVTKPWGQELWISGEHPEYAFKQVFIRTPHKTSLQFHNLKQETIVLFAGKARFYYKQNAAVKNENVQSSDLGAIELSAPTVVHIKPRIMHRFEALSDLTLYEASTPHLDDVIRVSDDSRRPDGRIGVEHG